MRNLFISLVFIMFNCHAQEKIILIADPEVLAIPIHENHEPLVDLTLQTEIAYGPPPIIANNTNYTKIRKSVYDKLKTAQATLPQGLKFCLYEGHRTLALQQQIFQERYNILLKANPNKTHEQIFIESTKFVSPIFNLDGSQNIPPHSTGAAVDVYLIDQYGKVVDMGIHLDDTYHDIDGTFCQTDSDVISVEAKAYRNIMNRALLAVGFINYPTEYWHWSYGDRYWAHQTGRDHAIYGSIIGS
jgi:D-alanyl-D-alanine dipeptidase